MRNYTWLVLFRSIHASDIKFFAICQLSYDRKVMSNFTRDLIFGCATASYQVEGAWDADGKGENIWDRCTHSNPKFVANEENGDVACDSYHLYEKDVELLKDIGFDMYRFSISWARILPEGEIATINQSGLQYYHNLIDKLLENKIQPMVTMYHWDLPQKIQDIGGWANPLVLDLFEDYANLLFHQYGDKVKWWITINEPSEVVRGYESEERAPALNLGSPTNYIVGHNLIKAHARVFRLYDARYRSKQKGKISMSLCACFFRGKNEKSNEDMQAAHRAMLFLTGWFAHPIFHWRGDYPRIMRRLVDEKSVTEGRIRSRLPRFSEEEMKRIKGTFDFFAVNHYTSRYATSGAAPANTLHSFIDADVNFESDSKWEGSKTAEWLKVVPWGLRELLRWVRDTYDNPPVFITENGYCDTGDLDDIERINYHREYLEALQMAQKEDGCNVIGYMMWSLLDNFEWKNGYEYRFGIVHVDFDDSKRKRTKKKSAEFFKQLMKTRNIPAEDWADNENEDPVAVELKE